MDIAAIPSPLSPQRPPSPLLPRSRPMEPSRSSRSPRPCSTDKCRRKPPISRKRAASPSDFTEHERRRDGKRKAENKTNQKGKRYAEKEDGHTGCKPRFKTDGTDDAHRGKWVVAVKNSGLGGSAGQSGLGGQSGHRSDSKSTLSTTSTPSTNHHRPFADFPEIVASGALALTAPGRIASCKTQTVRIRGGHRCAERSRPLKRMMARISSFNSILCALLCP